MSLLARRERRAVRWQDLWGEGEDVAPRTRVGDDQALRLDAVWACVRMLADGIASAPLQAFTERETGAEERVGSPPLLAAPSARVEPYDWLVQAVVSLCLRGNAYGALLDVRGGVPTRCEWLHPDTVQVFDDGPLRSPRYAVNGQPIPAEQVLHVRGMVLPGQVVGLSPVAYAAATIARAHAAQQFARGFFEGGGHPTGVLQTDQKIDAEQATGLKQRFLAALQGRREPVVLGAGTTFAAIQVSPEDSQFLDTEQWTVVQIARLFGFPPEMIGAATEGGSVTYANVEQRAINLNAWTFRPWATRIERAISRVLPTGVRCRFNLDANVRTDLKTRYEAHALGISAGFLSPNEARDIEQRGPIVDGDKFLWPRQAPPARENT